MTTNRIGTRLKQERERRKPKITQEDLSARLEIIGVFLDKTKLSKIEKNKRGVSDIELVGIAEALKVGIYWLLGLSDDRTK